MANSWTREEVEAIVADYFAMFQSELLGQPYNKTAHRNALLPLLSGRSGPSVERKHMNISAVLHDLGYPSIEGYKPLSNYQGLLFDVVEARIKSDELTSSLVDNSISDPIEPPVLNDFESVIQRPPDFKQREYILKSPMPFKPRAIKTNFLLQEARKQSLGLAGENFVMEFESRRLFAAGQKKLANKIEHVSQTQGDGLGYDILSFDENGKERLIEVKTTTFGKRTPFFITRNELSCSVHREEVFHLYRVFSFRKKPKLFNLPGRLDRNLNLEPTQYIAQR